MIDTLGFDDAIRNNKIQASINHILTHLPNADDLLVGCTDLTPQIAQFFLDNQLPNRKVNFATGKFVSYKKDLDNSNWHFNGDTIVFDKKGHMWDGQHRCYAVLRSKKSIRVLLVYGVEPSEMKDIGKNRTTIDCLALSSNVNRDLVNRTFTSMAKFFQNTLFGVSKTVSNSDVEAFLNNYRFELDAARNLLCKRTKSITSVFNKNPVHSAFFVAFVNGMDGEKLTIAKTILDTNLFECSSGIYTEKDFGMIRQFQSYAQMNGTRDVASAKKVFAKCILALYSLHTEKNYTRIPKSFDWKFEIPNATMSLHEKMDYIYETLLKKS